MSADASTTGKRLLPTAVDELAERFPQRVLYEITSSHHPEYQYREITAANYASAIDRAAWWLDSSLGKPTSQGAPTLGYVGPGDLRYLILVVGAIKVGYKVVTYRAVLNMQGTLTTQMLFTSPRNTVEGDLSVIEAVDCKHWLVPKNGSNVERLRSRVDLLLVDLPDLQFFLDGETTKMGHYPYSKIWSQGRSDPAWVLHTSGSTGNPKPVIRYQDSLASIEANNSLPLVNGRPLLLSDYQNSRVYLTFPLFHAAGLANSMLWPLFWGTTIVFGPDRPVTLDVMKAVIEQTKVDAVFTAPSIIAEISHDKTFLTLLESVKAIAFGGGPVPKDAGDRVNQHTRLRLSIGTTESGWLSCVETDPEDWNYLHFHPYTGLKLQPRDSGLYELVAVRRPELEPWQPIFSTFPDLQDYSFKDLFSRHPTKPNLYTYEGRADNILVLSNGEKVQPNSFELSLTAHPSVQSALLAGHGRFQTALLIELPERGPGEPNLRATEETEEIWSVVDASNVLLPAHARVSRDHIILASKDKPFARTGKGTIRKGPTLILYKEELDNVYDLADRVHTHWHLNLVETSDFETVSRTVRSALQEVSLGRKISNDDDIFSTAAIDSLQVLNLSRLLRRQLPASLQSSFGPRTIYANPSAQQLSIVIHRMLQHRAAGEPLRLEDIDNASLEQLLQGYTKEIGSLKRAETESLPKVILLTGSTGSLGSYILNDLMQRQDIEAIWCLNRSADAAEKQLEANKHRLLRTDFQERPVHFLHANLSSLWLGLDRQQYDRLSTEVTHIIHNQWHVDFNLQLSSFKPQLQGVRNLIELSHAALRRNHRIEVLFTSSVSVARDHANGTIIPSTILSEPPGGSNGYGQSKYVAEHLWSFASQQLGIRSTIVRIGQIAGPIKPEHSRGEWNRKEWLPSIIQLSRSIFALPSTLGLNDELRWIPVDILSNILLEIAFRPADSGPAATVFNLVNPSPASWSQDMLPVLQEQFSSQLEHNGKRVRIVSLEEWVEACNNASLNSAIEGSGLLPQSGIALIDFYRSLVRGGSKELRPQFDTTSAVAQSPTLRNLQPVNAEWIRIWLQQWANSSANGTA